MVKVARTAQHQIDRLIGHYLQNDRVEAAVRLQQAVAEAVIRIHQPGVLTRPFPGTHREIAAFGLSWLKVHVYWFGYKTIPGQEIAIVNVIWHRADIPARVVPFDGMQ